MPDVLIASDSPELRREVQSVLGRQDTVREVTHGASVLQAVQERVPDLVVLDQQIGNMGGMAACLDLRLEESGGRLGHVPVLLLLDRRSDVFLARRSNPDGFLVKPLDPMRLRRAMQALLGGGRFEDESFKPIPA